MIPSEAGCYAVTLFLASARRVRVGRLGMVAFPAGFYVYVGSAFGPGGLRARLAHHQRRSARPRWHVDYLRRRARVVDVRWVVGVRVEHEWARRVGEIAGAGVVAEGFGSSDCGCWTHLFHFEGRVEVAWRG